jgi:hypothetical protein
VMLGVNDPVNVFDRGGGTHHQMLNIHERWNRTLGR